MSGWDTNDDGTTATWVSWVDTASTSTTSASSDSSTAWRYRTAADSTSTTATTIWVTWANATTQARIIKPREETQAERLAREKREAEIRAAHEAAEKRRKEAADRATKLLRESLDKRQLRDLDEKGYFIVESTSGQRYRIHVGEGVHGNIDVLESDEKVRHRLCAAPTGGIPAQDSFLAQKLMLEADENEFLRIANRHPARRAA